MSIYQSLTFLVIPCVLTVAGCYASDTTAEDGGLGTESTFPPATAGDGDGDADADADTDTDGDADTDADADADSDGDADTDSDTNPSADYDAGPDIEPDTATECADPPWKEVYPPVTGEHIQDIYGTSSDNIFAVTDKGAILEFDGVSWSRAASSEMSFADLGVTGSSSVLATGTTEEGKAVVYGYNGAAWFDRGYQGTSESFPDVWGDAAGKIYTAGFKNYGTELVYYDGNEWITRAAAPPWEYGFEGDITELWIGAPDAIFGVGWKREPDSSLPWPFPLPEPILVQFEDFGLGWRQWQDFVDVGRPYDVWGTGPGDVYALGSEGLSRFNGSEWTPIPGKPDGFYDRLSGTQEGTVFAAGVRRGAGVSAARFKDGLWTEFPSTHNGAVGGTWAINNEELLVSGLYGLMMYLDDGVWTSLNGVSNARLTDAWGDDSGHLYVLDDVGNLLRGSERDWELAASRSDPSLPRVQLQALWGRSSNDIFAGGAADSWDGPLMLHFDGLGWSQVDLSRFIGAFESVYDLWIDGAGIPYVVVDRGRAQSDLAGPRKIMSRDGDVWQDLGAGGPIGVNAVWGAAANDIFAVGHAGSISRFNGETWITMPSGTDRSLRVVWGRSASEVYAGGEDGSLLYFNGETWQFIGWETERWDVSDIWADGPNDVYAIAREIRQNDYETLGTVYYALLHRSDGVWTVTEETSFDNRRPISIWGAGPSDVFVLFGDERVKHFDGASWNETELTGDLIDPNGMYGFAKDDIYVIANGGAVYHFNGSEWSQMESGTTDDLTSIYGNGAGDLFAAGAPGTVLSLVDEEWTTVKRGRRCDRILAISGDPHGTSTFATCASGAVIQLDGLDAVSMDRISDHRLFDVWCADGGVAFAVGNSGTILRFSGGTWQTMESGVSESLGFLWGYAADDIYAASSSGSLLHYDGETWTLTDDLSMSVSSLFGLPDALYVVTGDQILVFDGQSWQQAIGKPVLGVEAIWAFSQDDVYLVGDGARIFQTSCETERKLDQQ